MKFGLLGFWAVSLAWGQAPPTITGISNTASGVARVARGSLASIYGLNLAASTAQATSLPLPTLLAGVGVTIGGIPAPLIYVSPGQVNVQVPFEVSSASTLDVVITRDGVSGTPFSIPRDEYAPGIFLYPRAPTVFDPIIVHGATNQLVTPGNPAAANEPLVVYATGVGALTNPPRSGAASPSSPLAMSVDPVTATLGGNPVTVLFAGLTPGLVGLIQFNIQLSAAPPASSCLPLVVRVGGSSTPSVNLSTGPGGCSAPPGVPVISATPAKLDFGTIPPGQTANLLLTVRNTGNATLTVKSISSNNPRFTVTSPSFPFQVVADGLAAVTVQFAPTSSGAQSGTLTLLSDDPAHSSLSVDLAGAGTAPAVPALTFSPLSLDFGGVAVNQTKALTLTLRNIGTATLNVASVNTDTTRFSPTGFSFPTQIAAGGVVTVNVQFAPLVALPYAGKITITSNDPSHPVATIPASGMGTGGTPMLTLDPTTLDFGGVTIGQSKDVSLAVKNTGSATLKINEILPGASPAFLVTTRGPIVIPPSSQGLVTVRFQPLDEGQISDTFFIDNNDPVNFFKKVPVTGTGIVP